jgi:hypothetical protein
MVISQRGRISLMIAPKNPRITITPEAYQALCTQATLEGSTPDSLASRVILSYCTQEAKQALLAATWRGDHPHK